jgi:hypothetical protein
MPLSAAAICNVFCLSSSTPARANRHAKDDPAVACLRCSSWRERSSAVRNHQLLHLLTGHIPTKLGSIPTALLGRTEHN